MSHADLLVTPTLEGRDSRSPGQVTSKSSPTHTLWAWLWDLLQRIRSLDACAPMYVHTRAYRWSLANMPKTYAHHNLKMEKEKRRVLFKRNVNRYSSKKRSWWNLAVGRGHPNVLETENGCRFPFSAWHLSSPLWLPPGFPGQPQYLFPLIKANCTFNIIYKCLPDCLFRILVSLFVCFVFEAGEM